MAKVKYSKDYLLGWYHARAAYQSRGSVPPHPPGVEGKSMAPPATKRKPPVVVATRAADSARKPAKVKKKAAKKAKKKASKKK